jgi:anti-anti-sigma regulatory factor
VRGYTAIDVLRVRWDETTSGSAVASLVGGVDADAASVLEGLGRVAQLAPQLVVDLGRVTAIDRSGLDLVMGLGCLPNVTVRAPSPPVSRLLHEILLAA